MTTVGASTSESVREIYIGTLEAVPASIFPPLDYLALGHIHKPQVVGGLEHMRYSGSPIPLSFDELAQKKSVVLVDFAVHAEQQAQIQLLEVPRFQAMAMIKGDLAQIETQLLGFSGESKDVVESSEANEPLLPVWLDIEVETEDYLSDLQQRIQTLAEGLPVEILLIRRARKQRQAMMAGEAKETLDELNPKEVFLRRLDQEDWSSEALEARRERLNQCFDQALSQLEQGQ
jgi:exonuclease SbcD